MDKKDVVRFFKRFPDKITSPGDTHYQRMMSKKWKCSRCGMLYESDIEISIPSPYKECGDIFFEK
jgi:hypothetical protein